MKAYKFEGTFESGETRVVTIPMHGSDTMRDMWIKASRYITKDEDNEVEKLDLINLKLIGEVDADVNWKGEEI